MFVYFIRHGESYVNLKSWKEGNKDMGLTPTGEQQAAALADWMPKHISRPDAIYCSTMRRAIETAGPLAKAYEREVLYEDRIREIGNNQIGHQPFPNDNLPDYGEFWGSERPFSPLNELYENSESMVHFRARIGIFIEELIHAHVDQSVVVVCHGGVIDLSFDHIFDTGIWRRCEVWTKNTAVTCFQYVNHANRESWRLHYHNRIEHLANLNHSSELNYG